MTSAEMLATKGKRVTGRARVSASGYDAASPLESAKVTARDTSPLKTATHLVGALSTFIGGAGMSPDMNAKLTQGIQGIEAAQHEASVSAFTSSLEAAANIIPPQFMLEKVTQMVNSYQDKVDEGWVNTPDDVVSRAAKATGLDASKITGGRSEILLMHLGALKEKLAENPNSVTSYDILKTAIFETLARYETENGVVAIAHNEPNRAYPSEEAAWLDIMNSQTGENLIHEFLLSASGSTVDASDPAKPTPTPDNVNAPTAGATAVPENTTTLPAVETPVPPTPQVVKPDDLIDVSQSSGQQEIVTFGTYAGNTYSYDFNSQTVVAPPGVEMPDSTKTVFTENAQSLISVLGETPDFVEVKTSGQVGENSRNVVLAFKTGPNGESMYWATAFGENSYSPNQSFSTPNVTPKDVTYQKFQLPPGATHKDITVRFILGGAVENQIVEATTPDGTVFVFDRKQGEFIKMIDMPQGEVSTPVIDNYGKKFAEVYPDTKDQYTADAVNKRLSETQPEIYSAADGSPFKVLADPLTGQHLFIRTIDPITKEWGEWRELTSRAIMEVGVKPEDTFKYFSAQFSNPFESNLSGAVDDVLGNEFNAAYLNDGSWHVVEQIPNRPDYSYVVDAADDAQAHDMKFIMSAPLLDSGGDFQYVSSLKGKYDIDPQTLLDKVTAHITEETAALDGKVDAIIIANEIRKVGQNWPDGTPEDPYSGILGENYYETAARIIREATKDFERPVKIMINDGFNFQSVNGFSNGSNNTRQTLEIVNKLKSQGLIDGVGLQMHVRAWEKPNIPEMIKTFQDYGVPVYVTEFEVDVSQYPGSDVQKEQERIRLRKELIKAMLDSGVVVYLNHWFALNTESGDKGQLLDSSLKPTADLFAEREALFEHFFGE